MIVYRDNGVLVPSGSIITYNTRTNATNFWRESAFLMKVDTLEVWRILTHPIKYLIL